MTRVIRSRRHTAGTVVALFQAVIALVVAFGLNLAPDQIGAILAVTAAVLGLIHPQPVEHKVSTR